MDMITLLTEIQETITANKELLNDLDQQIGDGDHGTNMARGFEAVMAKKDSFAGKDAGQILSECAMVLISQVGGSSGPLVGTAFMKIGAALKGKASPSRAELAAAFRPAVEGIMMRGKSTAGEKTMLDVLVPALEAFEKNLNAPAAELQAAVLAEAQRGYDHTAEIIATKGRASYLKERSLGHKDPGACSSLLIIKQLLPHLT